MLHVVPSNIKLTGISLGFQRGVGLYISIRSCPYLEEVGNFCGLQKIGVPENV